MVLFDPVVLIVTDVPLIALVDAVRDETIGSVSYQSLREIEPLLEGLDLVVQFLGFRAILLVYRRHARMTPIHVSVRKHRGNEGFRAMGALRMIDLFFLFSIDPFFFCFY